MKYSKFTQIWFPLILIIILVSCVGYFFVFQTPSSEIQPLDHWANVSTIFLITPIIALFISTILFLVLFIAAIFKIHAVSYSFLKKLSGKKETVFNRIINFSNILEFLFSGPKSWRVRINKNRKNNKQ
jgi:hypothetical protein